MYESNHFIMEKKGKSVLFIFKPDSLEYKNISYIRRDMLPLLDDHEYSISIDLKDILNIDSSSIGYLVSLTRLCVPRIKLLNLSDGIRHVLWMTSLESLFDVAKK